MDVLDVVMTHPLIVLNILLILSTADASAQA